MADYSVHFANIQYIVQRLDEPLKTELAEIVQDLQAAIDETEEEEEENPYLLSSEESDKWLSQHY